jgi:hypothetical protein
VPTLSIITYHHLANEEASYPYDPSIADATPTVPPPELLALLHADRHEELVRAIDARRPKNP